MYSFILCNGYLYFYCHYKECKNNDNGICRKRYVCYPFNLFHKIDNIFVHVNQLKNHYNKNILKCPMNKKIYMNNSMRY